MFFWYRLTRVFPDKFHRAVKRLCVCVCVVYIVYLMLVNVLLLTVDNSETVKESRDETTGAADLADELQKQCAIVSAVQTSPLISGMTAGQLPTTPTVGISTSEQLRQLVALLSKKNEQWSVPLPPDRQLVVTDELQNSISKVGALVWSRFF